MRIHITVDDVLVAELDRRVGRGNRSAFITQTVKSALEDARRWDEITTSLGAIAGTGHDWDADPAGWIRAGRRAESDRVG